MLRLSTSATRVARANRRPPASGRRALNAITVLTLGGLAACGGDSGTTEPPPPPIAVTVSPSSATINAGATAQFTATVANTTNSGVTWSSTAGTIAANGASATWTAPGVGGSYTITAASVAEPARTASATVTVTAVGIAVAPATITIGAGDTVPLTASITNAANDAVTWTASAGSIVGSGSTVRWAAPVTGGSYTVTATSVLDPARTASATVTVTPVVVTIAAASDALFRGESTSLTATVTGTSNVSVTWSATCGTITGTGSSVQYAAPVTAGTCEVDATSERDPAAVGELPITVRRAFRVAALDDIDDGACSYDHCSFREALAAAAAEPDRDSILIIAGTAPATITLSANLPFVRAPLDIVGPGASMLAIDAAATQAAPRGVLYIDGDFSASVRGVTLRGGRRAGGGGLVIDNKANVTLHDVRVQDNRSDGTPGGGVLVLREGRGSFVDVEITGNQSSGTGAPGGGLAVQAGSLVTMIGGRLADNESISTVGGGAFVFNGALVFDGTTLANNRAVTTVGNLGLAGAVFADGPNATLSLIDAVVENNSATLFGGGLVIRGGAIGSIAGTVIRGNSAAVGAGMEIGPSTVTLTDSHLEANTASVRGGGAFVSGTAKYTHTGGRIRENIAASGGGGGIYLQNNAEVSLEDVAVNDNRADGGASGGGIWVGNAVSLDISGGSVSGNRATTIGGGLYVATSEPFSFTDVTIEDNEAVQAGGGAFMSSVVGTITDGSFSDNSVQAGGGGGIFVQTSTLTVAGTTFARNSTPAAGGGGMLALTAGTYTLREVIAEDNTANLGGALGFSGNMSVTIEGGVVRRNTSSTVGGGIWKAGQSTITMTGTQVLDNVAGTQGGGIQLVGPGAPATLRRVTVRGNTATAASGGGVVAGVATLIEESTFAGNTTGAIGGGLFSAGAGNSTVRNSTFSGNSAVVGGGIAATGPGTLTNVTLVANRASDYGGGIGTNNAGALTVRNVLLAANLVADTAGNCGRGGTSLITSTGGNLSGDATCSSFTQGTDKPNTVPGVNTTLADNGGPTFTHALLEGSAAINAAIGASCPANDQRGFARVGDCDIGAFEFGAQASSGSRASTMMRRR